MRDESVLCFSHAAVRNVMGDTVEPFDQEKKRLLHSEPVYYIPREVAEQDAGYVQLVPYVLLRYRNRYAAYMRSGSEDRLHGKWSIGFGGHINLDDWRGNAHKTAVQNMRREVAEEVHWQGVVTEKEVMGLIWDTSSEVSSMHLALVARWTVDGPRPVPASKEVDSVTLMHPSELRDLRLEDWTRVAVEQMI